MAFVASAVIVGAGVSIAGCDGSAATRTTDAPAPASTGTMAPGGPSGPAGASATSEAAPVPAETASETAISSELALATFDAVWDRVEQTDFDPGHGGVDWHAVRAELRPGAERSTSNRELRKVLYEMVSRLGRSHFAVIPGEVADRSSPASADANDRSGAEATASAAGSAATEADAPTAASGATHDHGADHDHDHGHHHAHGDGDAGGDADAAPSSADDEWSTFGLHLRLVEGRVVVFEVEPGSPAADAGVRPGWVLRSIDGADPVAPIEELRDGAGSMARYAVEAYVRGLDRGSRRSAHALAFLDLEDHEQLLTLRRGRPTTELVKIGTLPELPLRVDHRWLNDAELASIAAPGRRIGVIAFSIWMPNVAERLDRAVDELRDADGIILDLRGNPGGFAGMVMGVGGHFVAEPVGIGTMSTRDTTIQFRLNPRRVTRDGRAVEPIAAPMAILVDPLSASTSEVFAGGIQDVGRARVFGETSAGAVLPAQMMRLPNGDVLLHAFADYKVPSGTALEGRGVIPDHPRTLTRAAIAAEGDPVLMDAARWIRDAAVPVR